MRGSASTDHLDLNTMHESTGKSGKQFFYKVLSVREDILLLLLLMLLLLRMMLMLLLFLLLLLLLLL